MTSRKKRKKRERTTEGSTHENICSKYTTYLNRLQEGTQCYQILNHMIKFGEISDIEATGAPYYIMNLQGRIYDLRQKFKDELEIETEMVSKKKGGTLKRYGVYKLK